MSVVTNSGVGRIARSIKRGMAVLIGGAAIWVGSALAQGAPELVGVIRSVDSAAGTITINDTRYFLKGEAEAVIRSEVEKRGPARLRGKHAAYAPIKGEDGRDYVVELLVL